MKGVRKPGFCGKNHPLYGKHRSDETKKRISDGCAKGNRERWLDPEYRKNNSTPYKREERVTPMNPINLKNF